MASVPHGTLLLMLNATLFILDTFHCERYALAVEVHLLNAHFDVLADVDNRRGVGDTAVGHFGDMHQSVGVYAYVNESAELRDVGDHTVKLHAHFEVGDVVHAVVELNDLGRGARVASGLVKLIHDVAQGGFAHIAGDVFFYVDLH